MPDQEVSEQTVQQGPDQGPGQEEKAPVSAETLPPLAGESAEPAARGMDFVLDLPLQITVELGRTKMVVNDLLQLAQGSIIELEKMAGDPLEILVNDRLVARGEVVAVNEKFGIRVTDIVSPTERIESLG